ncbi:MAG: CoA-binding protein [Candidatus Hermodarchaeota archaeon]
MIKQESSDMNLKDISFIKEIKSMAVIGPSKKRDFYFLRNHQENFKGDLYAVHTTAKEISGFNSKNIYPSVKDIPGKVDFVFITVPSSRILEVIDDCVDKGVKLASIFTSEFSDSGTKEGEELEKELIRRAKNKLRILGPNGMGLYYPKLGIAWRQKFSSTPGHIGMIAQSGGICNIAIYTSQSMGIYFSKVFSFGNGADLDFVDILSYLCKDPETRIILCYLEGIKSNRGEQLKKVLSENKKPIIILKGGKSITGKVAVKTHTASITGSNEIWSALIKQYNLIEVDTLEQLLYVAQLIDFYGANDLKKIAIFSISGGYGVVLVDLIEKFGMKVPPFSPEIQKQLNNKFFTRGTSSKNPLDVAAQFTHSKSIKEIIEIALSDEKMDGLIMDFPSWYFSLKFFISPNDKYEADIIDALSAGKKFGKPLIPIIQRANCPEDSYRVAKILSERKVPVFGNPMEFIPLLPKISNYKKNLKI